MRCLEDWQDPYPR